jgi:hypothetical protein
MRSSLGYIVIEDIRIAISAWMRRMDNQNIENESFLSIQIRRKSHMAT